MCYECRELYCRRCSDTHLRLQSNHTLIDLDQPELLPGKRQEDSRDDDAEFSSDFIENIAVTETTVLYRAQVAVEGRRPTDGTTTQRAQATMYKKQNTSTTPPPDDATKAQYNPSDVRATKFLEFSTKITEDTDKVYVTGVLSMADKFVIVDNLNQKLKLYMESGEYISSTAFTEYTWGITRVDHDRFATCGFCDQIFLWKIDGNDIIPLDKTYKIDHNAYGIHSSGTYYCVLHRDDNAVTILDDEGRYVLTFFVKEVFGKKVEFGWNNHSDKDTQIYIPRVGENKGILRVSVEGEVLQFNALDGSPRGITEIHGLLCVVDFDNGCIKVKSKDWELHSKLLDDSAVKRHPTYIAFNDSTKKLIISYYNEDAITVFSLK